MISKKLHRTISIWSTCTITFEQSCTAECVGQDCLVFKGRSIKLFKKLCLFLSVPVSSKTTKTYFRIDKLCFCCYLVTTWRPPGDYGLTTVWPKSDNILTTFWLYFDYILTISDYFCRKDKKYKKDVDNSWHLYRFSRSLSVSLLVFVFVFVLLWNLCACPGQSGSNGIPMQFSWFAQSPINKSAFQGLALFTRRWRILSLIMDQSNITWPALFPNFIF